MLTKFIEPWLLFPGIVIVFLAAGAIILLGIVRHHRIVLRAARIARPLLVLSVATLTVAVALYALSTDALADRLMRRLESAYGAGGEAALTAQGASAADGALLTAQSASATGGALLPAQGASAADGAALPAALPAAFAPDAVVVLGGGVVASSPAEDGAPALSAEAESRLVYGFRLARSLGVPIVVSGGTVFGEGPAEGDVAAALLIELGMPPEMIRVEAASRTTAENAIFSARDFTPVRPAVVTSAYHMRRSLFAFRAAGLDPIPAPCVFRASNPPEPLRPDHFLPNVHALESSSIVWRETVGYWWYRIRFRR